MSNTDTQILPQNAFYARWLLYGIFYYGRFLDVVNCYWNSERSQLFPANKCFRLLRFTVRIILVICFWDVAPKLLSDFINQPRSFMQLFTVLQILSVAIFSVGLIWMKLRDELNMIALLNNFVKIKRTLIIVMSKNFTLCKKFVMLSCLKGFITFLGYINEMPNLFDVEACNMAYRGINVVIGVYLWLGSMFVMDTCYMGFLLLTLMYSHLGEHLEEMINKMQQIEAGSLLGASYTPYYRMRLLCDYSEHLDAINRLYSRLYRATKQFVRIFQWNILYYIYYNFMVISLLLNHCIWQYLTQNFLDFVSVFFIFVKISNLVLIIMVANEVVEKSELPNRYNLDVVCSDIDVRWDISVEKFISQRKVENLQIEVFGFFALNNEFMLLMLSAIITYLFFIIQFGMSGGFGVNT